MYFDATIIIKTVLNLWFLFLLTKKKKNLIGSQASWAWSQAFPLFPPTTNKGSCVQAESCVQGHMAKAPSKITFKHLWFHENGENGDYNINLASSFSFNFLWNRTEAKNFIDDSEHYRQKRKTTLNWVRVWHTLWAFERRKKFCIAMETVVN